MDPEQVPQTTLEIFVEPTKDIQRHFDSLSKVWTGGIPTVPGYDMEAVYTKLILNYRELKRRGEPVKLPWH